MISCGFAGHGFFMSVSRRSRDVRIKIFLAIVNFFLYIL